MKKEIIFYVISKGVFSNKLYLENPALYKIVPTTTTNVLNAKWYTNFEEAQNIAEKVSGEVEAFKILPLNDDEAVEEIETLKEANRQLRQERDKAINELNNYERRNICQDN